MRRSSVFLFSAIALLGFIGLSSCEKKKEDNQSSQMMQSCPDQPIVNPMATGEFDPIASPDAIPCGTIRLWGASMPKSFNMWQDYNSFSVGLIALMFEPLVGLHSTEDR
jgi:microcin C transport system substrate-binding protein